MQIRIFGKELFSYRKNDGPRFVGEERATTAYDRLKKSPQLPDFQGGSNRFDGQMEVVMTDNQRRLNLQISPKGVYMAKMLNKEGFKVNVDKKYVDTQISDFKRRLGLLSKAMYDMGNGEKEVASILIRFENRKKYSTFRSFYDKYPYTLTSRIDEVIKVNNHLKLGQVEQFVPDLPKEAIDAVKEYDETTQKLCGKKAVYYIIANKNDFKKTTGRRDPILLAQSPFGHFWQILGAWDEEMLLLEEL